jgi:hypothetical protein
VAHVLSRTPSGQEWIATMPQHINNTHTSHTQRLADLLSVIHAEEKLLRELGSAIAAIAVTPAPDSQSPDPTDRLDGSGDCG